LQALVSAAGHDIEYGDPADKYVKLVRRSIATAELAIVRTKLRRGIFKV
jgi:hypothetical protein